jgi:predicted nucleic acid-binding protein
VFVVDTSVWIEFYALRFGRETGLLRQAIEEDGEIWICGPILQEVLQGFRSEREYHEELRNLLDFTMLETTSWTYLRAAALYRQLRRRGVTVNSFDTTIAAVCLEHRLPLLTCNHRDFGPMAKYAGLKLA